MRQFKLVQSNSLSGLKLAMQSWHGRFVLVGLTVGLFYLPNWLPQLSARASQGSAGLTLILTCLSLALWQFWSQRSRIQKLTASEADQVLGHCLIVVCAGLFPFCQFAVWAQAILWLGVLVGIALSSWGLAFFGSYPLPVLLLALTVYPKPGVLARTLWEALTPYKFLERHMAQASAAALRWVGQPAIAEGSVVAIPPSGAVDVDWGCNGFNMAFTLAAAGLIMGLLLKQRWQNTLIIMVVGAILALMFNVPRIMLLAMASIHWGQASFKFWHGPWGGQIFSGVLTTVYYYAVMGFVNYRPTRVSKPD